MLRRHPEPQPYSSLRYGLLPGDTPRPEFEFKTAFNEMPSASCMGTINLGTGEEGGLCTNSEC